MMTHFAENIATTYDPSTIEQKWYEIWEKNGYFKPTLNQSESFSIVLPPPNVTGSLHMGHGFNNTIMDALTRYHRMKGYNTLWQPGTDHAGIATQMVVERKIAAEEGKTRHDLGREKFLEKIWQWKEQSGGMITQQIRRLGSSVDWTRERFTMDQSLSDVVREVFVQLYEQGLIYRGKRLVNWDPQLLTAISDLEVENRDEQGFMYHVRYPFVDKSETFGGGYMHIATTRPETILADGCLAVHPDDERYKDVIGKLVHVPMTDRVIPVVADPYPDPEFGTGCVKITPAHDFNDYEVGKRHDIEIINLMNPDATLNDNAPERYRGLDRFDARKKIVEDLEREGYLEKIEPHELKRPYGDRSGVVIEPYLTDQWYINIKPLAQPAIEAVQDGRIKFVPEQYTNMYMAWMKDIQDWCISRQLWWGHRIPAWYDEQGNVYVARNEEEVRAKYQLESTVVLHQDEDVLDTWFSSALWTFSTLGWTGNAQLDAQNEILKKFHSTSVLVTGFDIIFFWVARMIMMTMHFIKNEDGTPQVPFKVVYVHGLVRDSEGQKMSKSKGNVLDPLDLIDSIDLESLVQKRTTGLMNPKDAQKIEKATRKEFPNGIQAYGTDAVRFTFCALANTGRDIKFDLKRVEGYRNFCNKIWNATRFVLMNVESKVIAQQENQELWELPEQWIMSRLQKVEKAVALAFETYRLDMAAQAIYDFIWNEYCDWYVELTKPVLHDDTISEERKSEVRRILLTVLETALRIAHPLMPFITEEIWQIIAPIIRCEGKTIMLAPYPVADEHYINEQAETDMIWLQDLIGAVRNIRGEMRLGNARLLPVLLQNISQSERIQIERIEPLFKALAKVENLTFLTDSEQPPLSSSSVVKNASVFVPMKGLIDPQVELVRLQKEVDKIQKQHDQINHKLSNEHFVMKAPPAVIESERAKLRELTDQIAKIKVNIEQIQAL